ncbi:hypothetical protein Salat_1980200 [Sesamum alatum]|uniref:Uncharacterized protein n=1 Tax=Sesamum alatum TaxID=300844 RepID=A0AAE1Y6F3_9LAMI|nr:hypothetical protein Salat_1980200 [Sesamum alatum]
MQLSKGGPGAVVRSSGWRPSKVEAQSIQAETCGGLVCSPRLALGAVPGPAREKAHKRPNAVRLRQKRRSGAQCGAWPSMCARPISGCSGPAVLAAQRGRCGPSEGAHRSSASTQEQSCGPGTTRGASRRQGARADPSSKKCASSSNARPPAKRAVSSPSLQLPKN